MSDQDRSSPSAAPQQHTYHVPAVVVPQGGGAVLIRPGRPVERMTPAEFGARVGLSRSAVYRYLGTRALPDSMVVMAGARKILISAEAVPHFLAHWRLERGCS